MTEHKMSVDEMMAALQATGADISIKMRKPHDWYVSAGMEIASDGVLAGKYGNGETPQEAIADHWRIYSATTPLKPLVLHGNFEGEKRLWWSGFMWRDA